MTVMCGAHITQPACLQMCASSVTTAANTNTAVAQLQFLVSAPQK